MKGEAKPNRRRKWPLLGVVFVTLAAMLAGIGATNRPPFAFISKLHGERIPTPWPETPDNAPLKGLTQEIYAFRGKVDDVRAAMAKEMKSIGWDESPTCFGGVECYSDYKFTGFKFRGVGGSSPIVSQSADIHWYIDVPGYTCYVVVQRNQGWLDRHWAEVKGWFGVTR